MYRKRQPPITTRANPGAAGDGAIAMPFISFFRRFNSAISLSYLKQMAADLVFFGASNTNGPPRTIFESATAHTYAGIIAGAVRRNPSVVAKSGCTSTYALVFNGEIPIQCGPVKYPGNSNTSKTPVVGLVVESASHVCRYIPAQSSPVNLFSGPCLLSTPYFTKLHYRCWEITI